MCVCVQSSHKGRPETPNSLIIMVQEGIHIPKFSMEILLLSSGTLLSRTQVLWGLAEGESGEKEAWVGTHLFSSIPWDEAVARWGQALLPGNW